MFPAALRLAGGCLGGRGPGLLLATQPLQQHLAFSIEDRIGTEQGFHLGEHAQGVLLGLPVFLGRGQPDLQVRPDRDPGRADRSEDVFRSRRRGRARRVPAAGGARPTPRGNGRPIPPPWPPAVARPHKGNGSGRPGRAALVRSGRALPDLPAAAGPGASDRCRACQRAGSMRAGRQSGPRHTPVFSGPPRRSPGGCPHHGAGARSRAAASLLHGRAGGTGPARPVPRPAAPPR